MDPKRRIVLIHKSDYSSITEEYWSKIQYFLSLVILSLIKYQQSDIQFYMKTSLLISEESWSVLTFFNHHSLFKHIQIPLNHSGSWWVVSEAVCVFVSVSYIYISCCKIKKADFFRFGTCLLQIGTCMFFEKACISKNVTLQKKEKNVLNVQWKLT